MICSCVEAFLTTYPIESADFGNDEVHTSEFYIKRTHHFSTCSFDILFLINQINKLFFRNFS